MTIGMRSQLVLSGPHDAYSECGGGQRLRVTRVVQAPVNINGQHDFGDLESNIQTLIDEGASGRSPTPSIARRAYELYEIGGDGKAKTCRTGCERSKSFREVSV